MTNQNIQDKSFAFAIRIVNLSKYLQSEKKEFVLSKQVLRPEQVSEQISPKRSKHKAGQILHQN